MSIQSRMEEVRFDKDESCPDVYGRSGPRSCSVSSRYVRVYDVNVTRGKTEKGRLKGLTYPGPPIKEESQLSVGKRILCFKLPYSCLRETFGAIVPRLVSDYFTLNIIVPIFTVNFCSLYF